MLAVVLVLGGAMIGFSHPRAIALVVAELLVLIIQQTLRHWPRTPAH